MSFAWKSEVSESVVSVLRISSLVRNEALAEPELGAIPESLMISGYLNSSVLAVRARFVSKLWCSVCWPPLLVIVRLRSHQANISDEPGHLSPGRR